MFLITVSGSRGSGRGTILGILTKRFPSLYRIVPCTTRAPRSGEEHGKHMYFISTEEFDNFDRGNKLAYATEKIEGTYRSGTLFTELEKARSSMVDITAKGARILREAVLERQGSVLSFMLYADPWERYSRIRDRQSELSQAEVEFMIENDPTDPDPSHHPDFFIKVPNPNGGLTQAVHTIVKNIEYQIIQ